jgi:hypothetical protein
MSRRRDVMAMKCSYEPETRCISVIVWRDAAGNVDVLGVTPSVVRAYRTDTVIWDLISNIDGIKVEVKSFTRRRQKSEPMVKPPKGGNAKTNHKTGGHITCPIETDTDTGDFKYEIWLDGQLAHDPELQIREKP